MNDEQLARWVWGNIDHVTRDATFGRKHRRQRFGLGGTLFLAGITLSLIIMFY